mmetsp:Transcript_12304/g.22997  ORF Transcript_12304/g.22997 Transcript_12304/m.22997 type:complete len:90 (+) Transcript_12304:106-375(+)
MDATMEFGQSTNPTFKILTIDVQSACMLSTIVRFRFRYHRYLSLVAARRNQSARIVHAMIPVFGNKRSDLAPLQASIVALVKIELPEIL